MHNLTFNPFPSINYLSEKLSGLESWQNPRKYKITEYFPYSDKQIANGLKPVDDYSPIRYELTNLKMDIENNSIAYCTDDEEILEQAMYNGKPYALQAFVIQNIIYIAFQNETNQVTISFDGGFMVIKY
jgi:hypothetical protein